MHPCISLRSFVHLLVRLSVRPFIRPSVRHKVQFYLKWEKFDVCETLKKLVCFNTYLKEKIAKIKLKLELDARDDGNYDKSEETRSDDNLPLIQLQLIHRRFTLAAHSIPIAKKKPNNPDVFQKPFLRRLSVYLQGDHPQLINSKRIQ